MSESEEAAYRRGLARAAEICAEQERMFLAPSYAAGQPMGSFAERFACRECAAAIRSEALITPAGLDAISGKGG